MNNDLRVELWDAINAYAAEAARSQTGVRRQEAVAVVETCIRKVEAAATEELRKQHRAEIRQLERDAREEIRDAVAEDRWQSREAAGDDYHE